jgi:hypothetical protein
LVACAISRFFVPDFPSGDGMGIFFGFPSRFPSILEGRGFFAGQQFSKKPCSGVEAGAGFGIGDLVLD